MQPDTEAPFSATSSLRRDKHVLSYDARVGSGNPGGRASASLPCSGEQHMQTSVLLSALKCHGSGCPQRQRYTVNLTCVIITYSR